MSPLRRAVDWTFRDRMTGRITVAQWPNLPLWLFLGLSGLGWFVSSQDPYGPVLQIASGAALAWWAADELLRGVNPWRRVLGGAVLVWLVAAITRVWVGT